MQKSDDNTEKTLDIKILDMVEPTDPILRQVCEKVDVFDDDLIKLVDSMCLTLHAEGGLGLAANQVGIDKRIFVRTDSKNFYTYVNPEVEVLSTERNLLREGCLSSPGIWCNVKRPTKIRIHAFTEFGEPFSEILEDMNAAIVLHELDHLNGVRFIDRTSKLARNRLREKLFKDRKTHLSSIVAESLTLFPETVTYELGLVKLSSENEPSKSEDLI